MSKTAVPDIDRAAIEAANVLEWRLSWLRHGGFNKRNARVLAENPRIDWRYANNLLANAKRKGYDETFVMNLLHD